MAGPETSIKTYTFTGQHSEYKVAFNITKFANSLFIWVGAEEHPTFDRLSYSVPLQLDSCPRGELATSNLFGYDRDDVGEEMAQRLAKRIKQPVMLSFNLPSHVGDFVAWVEQTLLQHLIESVLDS